MDSKQFAQALIQSNEEHIHQKLAQDIKSLRLMKGYLTCQALESDLDLKPGLLSDFEQGKSAELKFSDFLRLCVALDATEKLKDLLSSENYFEMYEREQLLNKEKRLG